jgi:hypothetical protein
VWELTFARRLSKYFERDEPCARRRAARRGRPRAPGCAFWVSDMVIHRAYMKHGHMLLGLALPYDRWAVRVLIRDQVIQEYLARKNPPPP